MGPPQTDRTPALRPGCVDNQSGCLPEAADQLLGGANQEVVTEPAWVDIGQAMHGPSPQPAEPDLAQTERAAVPMPGSKCPAPGARQGGVRYLPQIRCREVGPERSAGFTASPFLRATVPNRTCGLAPHPALYKSRHPGHGEGMTVPGSGSAYHRRVEQGRLP